MSRSKNVEVVTDVSRCRDIVRELEKSDVITVVVEGVHLSKVGPLTLLQVGTVNHNAYLFDIHTNKALFTNGKLQDILTSPRTKKVMHSCSDASAALYYQFNIRLQNVFDTQVANLMIEENRGRELVTLMKLDDLCKKYSSVADFGDQHDTVEDMWTTEIGDRWAKRPLSDDMVQYAAGKVTSIVPEVYNTMKKHIEENGMLDQFNKRVEEEILFIVDERMREQRKTRVNAAIGRVLRTIDKKYQPDIDWKDIDDPDVQMAIPRVHVNEAETLSPLINRLKRQSIQHDLDELEESFASKEGVFNILNGRFDSSLKTAYEFKQQSIRDRMKTLQDSVVQITLDHMARKYDVTTPVTYISRHEKDVLYWLRPFPSGEYDSRYHKVVLALYWKLMESGLDDTIQRFDEEPIGFTMREGHYKQVRFYINQRSRVPRSIKVKAQTFIRKLDQTFGRGVVPAKQ